MGRVQHRLLFPNPDTEDTKNADIWLGHCPARGRQYHGVHIYQAIYGTRCDRVNAKDLGKRHETRSIQESEV